MNNDYLWDRTGEPDVEVQELEEVLGSLRYQPRPFVLPADVQPAPRRRFSPWLAIAAAIALMVLAVGVWLRGQRQRVQQVNQIIAVNKEGSKEKALSIPSPPTPGPADELTSKAPKRQSYEPASWHGSRARTSGKARNSNRNNSLPSEEMTAAEREDAEAAKDQLMLALRVVSAKLNLAQRKTVPTTNNIRYQHKVG